VKAYPSDSQVYLRGGEPFRNKLNFPVMGLIFQKGNFSGKIFHDIGLQAPVSTKWLQIAESHDGLMNLQNVDFPFVPMESTQWFPWPAQRTHGEHPVPNTLFYDVLYSWRNDGALLIHSLGGATYLTFKLRYY